MGNYSTMVFMHEFGNEKAFNEGREVALSIPFTHRVWKTREILLLAYVLSRELLQQSAEVCYRKIFENLREIVCL